MYNNIARAELNSAVIYGSGACNTAGARIKTAEGAVFPSAVSLIIMTPFIYPIISSIVKISNPSFFPFSLIAVPSDVVRIRPSSASATARDM